MANKFSSFIVPYTLDSKIFLVQTDTTVGFLSKDVELLYKSKQRDKSKKILQELDGLATLKSLTRVPNIHKKRVRNSIKTTFIYPNHNSYRVVDKKSKHYNFISKFKSLYSTSANKSGEGFDEEYARNKADIIVESKFSTQNPSKIYRLTQHKIKRIR